ncbi:MAG: 2-amino-3,7-dideoxy-D-threo-hept-6-ulosonate synthase [Nitrososphaerota archaeon]
MVFGKQVRLNRITERGKMLCIPMDHGITIGPVKGLDKIFYTIEKVSMGGATAVLMQKGILRMMPKPLKVGTIMHVSASTSLGPSPNFKVRVSSVEEALRLGADAVSVHVNIGCSDEPRMLRKLGMLADECDRWHVPFIAMMYPRGENIKNPNDPDVAAHVARIGAELGADIVKTPYTGSPETFRKVVDGCPVPIVIAGGPKAESDLEVLKMVREAMDAGAIGAAIGRNVFQHDNPFAITKALRAIIVEDYTVDEALEVLKDASAE